MTRKILLEIICVLFIFLFAYAAVNKLLDYPKFRIQVGQSPLLTGFGDFIPWIVISIELLIAVLLAIPPLRLIALLASFSLMTLFTAYIFAILNFGSFVPCSCGGILETLTWTQHLYFNAIFVLIALLGIGLENKGRRMANHPHLTDK